MKCSQREFSDEVTFDCSINNESNATLAVTHGMHEGGYDMV